MDVDIYIGDVLEFSLDVGSSHPFWIKTAKGIGKDNAVSSGISGVGQGKTSGVLIWDTTEIMAGTYYYQCEFHAPMFGRIIVAEKTGETLFGIHVLYYPFYLAYRISNHL